MSSSCRRPGCTKVAAVTIRYDPVSCQLWLDPIIAGDRSVQSLCVDHAERLSPPRGWVVVDRRGAQTTIVTAPAVAAADPAAGGRRVRRRWGSFEAPTLEFTAVEPEALPPEALPPEAAVALPESVPALPETEPIEVRDEPEPGPAPEPEPVPSAVGDDLGDLLKPRGGLLGRAFESTGPQRSAITLPSADDPA
jgi:hypothetical protein